VVELVDALASGASGLTAVKVRVLSWAPFLPMPSMSLKCAALGSKLTLQPFDPACLATIPTRQEWGEHMPTSWWTRGYLPGFVLYFTYRRWMLGRIFGSGGRESYRELRLSPYTVLTV
jgi:hypothetical protein